MKTITNITYPALALFAFAWLALVPRAQAVNPPPDGGYPNGNTAEGQNALFSVTTGRNDTAIGRRALYFDNTGNDNTGTGFNALTTNTTGFQNTANGSRALAANTVGDSNTAMGFQAAANNQDGDSNIAIGNSAAFNNISGGFNTVVGDEAGQNITDGFDDIYIGATSAAGVTNESGTIRIGDPGFVFTCFIAGINGSSVTGDGVCVDANGQLGVCADGGKPDAMNQLAKEHQVVQELKNTTEKQAARIALLEERIALQDGQILALTATLKQQAAQIQKVSGQLEASKLGSQIVSTNP